MGGVLRARWAAVVFGAALVSACASVLGDFSPAEGEDGGAADAGQDGAGGDGAHDTGAVDSTVADSARDTASPDTTVTPDTSVADTTPEDVALPDAPHDAPLDVPADTTASDTAPADTSAADSAAPPDTSSPDTSSPADSGVDSMTLPEAAPETGPADSGFSVSSVSGLVLWLLAGKGVTQSGGNVSAVADQSSAGNNAVAGGSGATVALAQPDFPNGQPGFSFGVAGQTPGTWQILQVADSTSLQFSGDFLIETVVKMDLQGTGVVYEKQISNAAPFQGIGMFLSNVASDGGPGTMSWLLQIDENHSLFGDASVLSPANPSDLGTWRIYGAQRVADVFSIRINGALNASVSTATGSATWTPGIISAVAQGASLGVGGQPGTPGHLVFEGVMDVAEVIAVSATVSPSDLASIESYLQSKYALP